MPQAGILPLYDAAGTRALDRQAIEGGGIPGYTLMCRAGQALFDRIGTHWPRARRLCVLCGAGNNGGDGYVLARLARAAGLDVQVLALADPAGLGGDAATACRDFVDAGGEVEIFAGPLPEADLYVDALLGTGIGRAVEGRWATAIESLNTRDAPVLAVDIPSGLCADTGRVRGIAVEAGHTVTFIGRKLGLYTGTGPALAGEVHFAGLQLPAGVYEKVSPVAGLLQGIPLGPLAQRRRRDAHKGRFGHVLVLGGAPGMGGAARLAAEAALRCGAGLVSVATHPSHAAQLPVGRWELMAHGVDAAPALDALLQRASVVVAGPGLGRSPWARALLERVLEMAPARAPALVLDADALNLLAADPVRREGWILTPHPGEAARLLGWSTRKVQEDRRAAARALHDTFGGTVILKGAGSIIDSGALPAVCAAGNPGMASGGMGDVLSGVLGALLAQGLEPDAAARAGVCLHAVAGDRAAVVQGERGLLAGDLMPHLRSLVNGDG